MQYMRRPVQWRAQTREAEDDIEAALAKSLCLHPVTAAGRSRAERILTGVIDWDRFFDITERWQVESTVLTNLEQIATSRLPHDILETLRTRKLAARALSLAKCLQLKQVLASFGAANIPVIVLKGPALGIAAFGDPIARSFGDLDLLVKPEHLASGCILLSQAGFVKDYDPAVETVLIDAQHALEFSSRSVKVELHSSLLSRRLRMNFPINRVWATAVVVQFLDSEICILSPSVQFVFACAHGAKHEWMSMRWMADVGSLAARLREREVSEVVQLSSELHARRVLSLGLCLSMLLLDASVGAFPARYLTPDASTLRLIRFTSDGFQFRALGPSPKHRWQNRLEPGMRSFLYWVAARERWVDRVRCIGGAAFGPWESRADRPFLSRITRPVALALKTAKRLMESN